MTFKFASNPNHSMIHNSLSRVFIVVPSSLIISPCCFPPWLLLPPLFIFIYLFLFFLNILLPLHLLQRFPSAVCVCVAAGRAEGSCCCGAPEPSCRPASLSPGGTPDGSMSPPSYAPLTESSTAQLSSVFCSSQPSQMKSLVCGSDMPSQYFPAVDLVTGFYFCQMINGLRN